MKLIFTFSLLCSFSLSFSQWTRVQQLPATDIGSLYRSVNTLYAGGMGIVYFTNNGGGDWDSTSRIPQLGLIDNIIVHEHELYVSSFSFGVYKSTNDGFSWQNIGTGIIPFVSDFCEWKGDLYAATEGAGNFKLDPLTRNKWSSFANGLSSLSTNVTCMASNSNALVSGTLGNALYDYFPAGGDHWEERFLLGQLHPTEGIADIITVHDSLFLPEFTGKYYLSTDNGLNWENIGMDEASNSVTVANANEALLFSRNNPIPFLHTNFSYMKKDSFNHPFVNFSVVANHYSYRIEVFNDKIWDASSTGLFFMPLSLLPGITDPNDPLIIVPLDIISFNAHLNDDRSVQLQWQTSGSMAIAHFEIERSKDGLSWNGLANAFPGSSNEYVFTDAFPLPGINYYRIKEVHANTTTGYTVVKTITVDEQTHVRIWPNPAMNELHLQLPVTKNLLEIIDATGKLVFKNTVYSGSIVIPVSNLQSGIYILRIKTDAEISAIKFFKE